MIKMGLDLAFKIQQCFNQIENHYQVCKRISLWMWIWMLGQVFVYECSDIHPCICVRWQQCMRMWQNLQFWVCVCICMHICACVCLCMHMYVCMCKCVHEYVCMCVCVYIVWAWVVTSLCVGTYRCTSVCTSLYTSVCTSVCMSVCMSLRTLYLFPNWY